MPMIKTDEFNIEMVRHSELESPVGMTTGEDMVYAIVTHKPSGLKISGDIFVVDKENPAYCQSLKEADEQAREYAIRKLTSTPKYIEWDLKNNPQPKPKKSYSACKKISITVECDGVDHFMLVPDEFLQDNFDNDISKYVSKLTIIERKENGEVREYRLSKGEVK